MLETKNLIIRHAKPIDALDIYEMLTDEEILKYNCMNKPDLEQLKKRLYKVDSSNFYIELKKENKVIGSISIEEDSLRYQVNSYTISYFLNTDYTKKGYMSEALIAFIEYLFNEPETEIISARCFAENENSIRLLNRLNFTYEGKLRYAVKGYDNKIHDDLLFSLKREEFKKV